MMLSQILSAEARERRKQFCSLRENMHKNDSLLSFTTLVNACVKMFMDVFCAVLLVEDKS